LLIIFEASELSNHTSPSTGEVGAVLEVLTLFVVVVSLLPLLSITVISCANTMFATRKRNRSLIFILGLGLKVGYHVIINNAIAI
jgi:hypothetical protein